MFSNILVCARLISNTCQYQKQGRVLRSTEVQWLSARICPVKRDGSGWFINPPLPGWQIRPDERTLERVEFGLVGYWKALDLREATTSMGSSNYANPSRAASLVVVLLVPRGLKADTPTSWVNAI